MKKKLPNIISLIRAFIAPIFLLLFISGEDSAIVWSCILFVIGAFSDYLDGWLARKMKADSAWGRFFDPLADKFLTTGAFFAFAFKGIIPFWMVWIIVIRDFATTIMRVFASETNPMKTSKSAKMKTFLQMLFISGVLLLFFFNSFFDLLSDALLWQFVTSPFVYYSFLIITVITVWTLIEYVADYKKA